MIDFIADDDGGGENNNNKSSFLSIGCFSVYQKPSPWPDSQQVHGGGRTRLEFPVTRLRNLPIYPERGEVGSARNVAVFCHSAESPAQEGGTRLSLGLNPSSTLYKLLKQLTALSRASVSLSVLWGLHSPLTMLASQTGRRMASENGHEAALEAVSRREVLMLELDVSVHPPIHPWETEF